VRTSESRAPLIHHWETSGFPRLIRCRFRLLARSGQCSKKTYNRTTQPRPQKRRRHHIRGRCCSVSSSLDTPLTSTHANGPSPKLFRLPSLRCILDCTMSIAAPLDSSPHSRHTSHLRHRNWWIVFEGSVGCAKALVSHPSTKPSRKSLASQVMTAVRR